MISNILKSDLLKIRRSWIPFLLFLGPFGVIIIQVLSYHFRPGLDAKEWGGLFLEVNRLLLPTIALGITLLASIIAGTEHQANAWKQLLALPVSKIKVFISKYLWLFGLLLFCCLITSIGMVWLGFYLDFEAPIPWAGIFKDTLYCLLAALPLMSIQLWLSMIMHNQAIPITVGIFSIMFGGPMMPDWLPLTYLYLVGSYLTDQLFTEALIIAMLGIGVGFILLLLGSIDFARRDVK